MNMAMPQKPTLDATYLHEITKPVQDHHAVEHIIKDMQHVMYAWRGQGIAANQIGYTAQMCIINTKKTREVMINPQIVDTAKTFDVKEEGCLSLPGKKYMVPRFTSCTVIWYTPQGRRKQRKFKKHDARVVQHEIDHLFGVTIEDRFKQYYGKS